MMRTGRWSIAAVVPHEAGVRPAAGDSAAVRGVVLGGPLDVPAEVVDFVAGQLGIEDPSCVKRYTERDKTRFDHAWEIRQACELKEFAEAEPGLRRWVAARSWTSGDGPKAIFTDAVRWLRERDVLLPGVTTLARLVTNVREETTQRLWKMPTLAEGDAEAA